ncbi:MAG: hypothetical protein LBH00_02835 [Planctomycetaceae bacterium]|jgi:hypothetical protein|nr:hypothetical protein [Planctomycetaceae bacterium]
MAVYLIDYENPVGQEFIRFADTYKFASESFWITVKHYELSRGGEHNKVVLFYSQCSPQSGLAAIKKKCSEHYEYIPNGIRNGLDFQLSTYLGSQVHGNTGMPEDSRFYIVSGDKGFGSVVHFWEKNCNFCGLSFELLSSVDDFRRAFITSELDLLNIRSMLYTPDLNEDLETAGKRQDNVDAKMLDIYLAFFESTDNISLHIRIRQIIRNNAECKEIYRSIRPIFNRRTKLKQVANNEKSSSK